MAAVVPTRTGGRSLLAHLAAFSVNSYFVFELALVSVAAVLWYHDGILSIGVVWSAFTSGVERIRETVRSDVE